MNRTSLDDGYHLFRHLFGTVDHTGTCYIIDLPRNAILLNRKKKNLKKKRNECLFIPLTPKRVISSNSNFNTSLKASNFNTSLY